METIVIGTVTVGAVASGTVEFLKKLSWFPQNPTAYRLAAAIACLLLSASFAVLTGQPVDLSTIGQTFLSYLGAVSAYDHLVK
jgi:hypothetical protein